MRDGSPYGAVVEVAVGGCHVEVGVVDVGAQLGRPWPHGLSHVAAVEAADGRRVHEFFYF